MGFRPMPQAQLNFLQQTNSKLFLSLSFAFFVPFVAQNPSLLRRHVRLAFNFLATKNTKRTKIIWSIHFFSHLKHKEHKGLLYSHCLPTSLEH